MSAAEDDGQGGADGHDDKQTALHDSKALNADPVAGIRVVNV
jgi:hypothetical protein